MFLVLFGTGLLNVLSIVRDREIGGIDVPCPDSGPQEVSSIGSG